MLIDAIDTLIFDLDNTLIDRNAAMRLSLHHWLSTQGYDGEQLETALANCMLQDDWGYTNRLTFCTWLLQTYGNKQSNNLAPQQLQHWLHKKNSLNVQPNPQVQYLLQNLSKDYQLVLATNGGSVTQRAKLQQAQLVSFFQPEAIFVSGEMEFEKPDPQYFKKIIHELQLNAERSLVIGDNLSNDIQAAMACGLFTCWVSHGRELQTGIQPHKIISNITEISAWSKQLT